MHEYVQRHRIIFWTKLYQYSPDDKRKLLAYLRIHDNADDNHTDNKGNKTGGNDGCRNREPLALVENNADDAEHQRHRNREQYEQSSKDWNRTASAGLKDAHCQNYGTGYHNKNRRKFTKKHVSPIRKIR